MGSKFTGLTMKFGIEYYPQINAREQLHVWNWQSFKMRIPFLSKFSYNSNAPYNVGLGTTPPTSLKKRDKKKLFAL